MQIFLDVDGVMGDFDAHVQQLFGVRPREIPDQHLWAMVENEPTFWTDMPIKHGAVDLFSLARPFNPIFLTGCPRTGFERAAAHKREWIAKHFGDEHHVITCRSRDKQSHMKAPGDLLVDDFFSNIKRWQSAGGITIHYRNAHQATKELEELLTNKGWL